MATAFPIPTTTAAKGAVGELIACAWLVGLGYEVFRNVSYHGPADIVAWLPSTGETHLIDVKTVAPETIFMRADGSLSIPLTRTGVEGVHRLLVVAGEAVGFCKGGTSGVEFYWPLSCPQVPVGLTAPCYLESALRSRRIANGRR
jgi:hypothetical protein